MMNKRGCYCGIWDTNPEYLESRGVPRGYCGFCQRCNKPGHVRHFPGAVPYTGCWCDYHYRLISLIHPLGSLALLLYLVLISGGVIVWMVFRH